MLPAPWAVMWTFWLHVKIFLTCQSFFRLKLNLHRNTLELHCCSELMFFPNRAFFSAHWVLYKEKRICSSGLERSCCLSFSLQSTIAPLHKHKGRLVCAVPTHTRLPFFIINFLFLFFSPCLPLSLVLHTHSLFYLIIALPERRLVAIEHNVYKDCV